jgi:murein DD-endopeptidase MepM/ murein hydrolase activator NlpD
VLTAPAPEPEPVAVEAPAAEPEPEPVVVTAAPEPAASGTTTTEVLPAPAPEPVVAAVPQPEPRAEALFAWPVQGPVLSSFGSKPGGLNNDGINIGAARGTPVVAAENGVVVYAGNEIPGFGNLILIRHADGWATAYAHNDKLLVAKGDSVARGQPIAQVGATGSVTEPQSHFEIRKGNEPVDPLSYLSPR